MAATVAAATEYPREAVESCKAVEHTRAPLIQAATPIAVSGKPSAQSAFGYYSAMFIPIRRQGTT